MAFSNLATRGFCHIQNCVVSVRMNCTVFNFFTNFIYQNSKEKWSQIRILWHTIVNTHKTGCTVGARRDIN